MPKTTNLNESKKNNIKSKKKTIQLNVNGAKKNKKNFESIPETRDLFEGFNAHVPRWDAKIKISGRQVNVSNTCSIDYFLFIVIFS